METHPLKRLLLAIALIVPLAAAAQPYPSKPIRFVVPYPAGGQLDTVARIVGERVSESVGEPVIVENKAGAGGNIGADLVAKSAPDGYTILMGAVATHAINPSLYASVPYERGRISSPSRRSRARPTCWS